MTGNVVAVEAAAADGVRSFEWRRRVALVGEVLLTPGTGLARVRREPHWLLPLALYTLATFVHTLIGLPFTLERVNRRILASNPAVSPEALAQASDIPRFVAGAASLLAALVAPLVILLITAGLLHVSAVLLRGRLATEGRAAFSLACHAAVVLALALVARAPLVHAQGSVNVSLGLDALLPHSTWAQAHASALQFFDAFRLWFMALLAAGVKTLYELPLAKAWLVSLAVNLFWFGVFVLLLGTWSL